MKFSLAAGFAAAVSGIAALAGGPVMAQEQLTIASWGGTYQEHQKDVLFTPFTAGTGIAIREDNYLGGWAPFQAMADTGTYKWDVVQTEGPELLRGCEEGVFLRLDWSKIPNSEQLIPEAKGECGLGVVTIGSIIIYNTGAFATPPRKMTDFFDLEKFPGKRGIRKGPKINLEYALMAAGVELDDIYKTLSTPEGLDLAFSTLDKIKSELVTWEAGAQPIDMVSGGSVAMSIAYNGRFAAAREDGRPIDAIWDRGTYSMDYWAVPSGTKVADAAYKFLDFYSDKSRQAEFVKRTNYGPTVQGAEELLTPEKREMVPTVGRLKTHLFSSSTEALNFWLDNYPSLLERWNAWISSK